MKKSDHEVEARKREQHKSASILVESDIMNHSGPSSTELGSGSEIQRVTVFHSD